MAKCPFTKKQCPETNKGKDGCQHWKEFLVSRRISHDDPNAPANVATEKHGDCVHVWTAAFTYELNFKSLGIQAATESFRNEVVDGGKTLFMTLATINEGAKQARLQQQANRHKQLEKDED